MRVICALLVFLSRALVSAQVLKNYTVGESSFPDCPRESERNGLQKPGEHGNLSGLLPTLKIS